jgi:glyoxylase-like metal-dependent hydrolase (beta-lactamase superfamily II)
MTNTDMSPKGGFEPMRTPHDAPKFGAVTQLEAGVLWSRMPMPKPLGHVNVYIFDEGDSWTIVDTGVDSKLTRDAWRRLLEGPLAGKPIKRVLVTHHHLDHIGLAGWFMSEHGAELVTTRTAYVMARMLQLDVQEMPTTEMLAFWRACGAAEDVYKDRAHKRPFNTADAVAPLPLGFTRIQQGDEIEIGGRLWDVRIGHGHAPEHATLWARDETMVIGGDQLLGGISPNLGVSATEPDADTVGEWMTSCEGFEPFAHENQLVLVGHKLPYTGLPARLSQLIRNHHTALERLRVHLQTPHTACECFMPLFKREVSGGEYGLAMVEAMAHCVHLWHQGQVKRVLREDGAVLWQAVSAELRAPNVD